MENRAYIIFEDLNILQYAEIQSCFVRLTAASTMSGGTVKMQVAFSNEVDPVAPVDADDLWNRDVIGGDWEEWTLTGWTAYSTYDSPDISAALQSIVDRPDWVSGSSVMLIMEDDESDDNREFWSYRYDSAYYAAELHVTHAFREIDLYHDYFPGSSGQKLDTRRWHYNSENGESIRIWNNEIQVRNENYSPYQVLNVNHVASFDGDFDVQIKVKNFTNLALPNENYFNFRAIYPYGSSAQWYVARNFNDYTGLIFSPNDETQKNVSYSFGTNSQVFLRLKRVGSTIYGYKWDYNDVTWVDRVGDSVFDSVGHSEQYMEIRLRFKIYYLSGTPESEVLAKIDDFIVTSGTLVRL